MEQYVDKRDPDGNITNLDELIRIMIEVSTNPVSEKLTYFEDLRVHVSSADRAKVDAAIAKLRLSNG